MCLCGKLRHRRQHRISLGREYKSLQSKAMVAKHLGQMALLEERVVGER